MRKMDCREPVDRCSLDCLVIFALSIVTSTRSSGRSTLGIADNTDSRRLQAIPGIGARSPRAHWSQASATRMLFRNGRQFAAWLGPCAPPVFLRRQRNTLLGISKRGDTYLRTLLIHGARAVLQMLHKHPDQADGWLARVSKRPPFQRLRPLPLRTRTRETVWALLCSRSRVSTWVLSDEWLGGSITGFLQIVVKHKPLAKTLTNDCTGRFFKSDGITETSSCCKRSCSQSEVE